MYKVLLFTGKDKMDLPKEVDLKFVLEADGTEIDGPFFCTLQDLTILQVLKPEEQWHGNYKFV